MSQTILDMNPQQMEAQALTILNQMLQQNGMQGGIDGVVQQIGGLEGIPMVGGMVNDIVANAANANGIPNRGGATATLQQALQGDFADKASEILHSTVQRVAQENPTLAGNALAQKITQEYINDMNSNGEIRQYVSFVNNVIDGAQQKVNELNSNRFTAGALNALPDDMKNGVAQLSNVPTITLEMMRQPLQQQLSAVVPAQRGASQETTTTETPAPSSPAPSEPAPPPPTASQPAPSTNTPVATPAVATQQDLNNVQATNALNTSGNSSAAETGATSTTPPSNNTPGTAPPSTSNTPSTTPPSTSNTSTNNAPETSTPTNTAPNTNTNSTTTPPPQEETPSEPTRLTAENGNNILGSLRRNGTLTTEAEYNAIRKALDDGLNNQYKDPLTGIFSNISKFLMGAMAFIMALFDPDKNPMEAFQDYMSGSNSGQQMRDTLQTIQEMSPIEMGYEDPSTGVTGADLVDAHAYRMEVVRAERDLDTLRGSRRQVTPDELEAAERRVLDAYDAFDEYDRAFTARFGVDAETAFTRFEDRKQELMYATAEQLGVEARANGLVDTPGADELMYAYRTNSAPPSLRAEIEGRDSALTDVATSRGSYNRSTSGGIDFSDPDAYRSGSSSPSGAYNPSTTIEDGIDFSDPNMYPSNASRGELVTPPPTPARDEEQTVALQF